MNILDALKGIFASAPAQIEAQPEPPEVRLKEPEEHADSAEGLGWVEQTTEGDYLYSLQDLLSALRSGDAKDFGIYSSESRKITFSVRTVADAHAAVRLYALPERRFAYLTDQGYVLLYLVIDP